MEPPAEGDDRTAAHAAPERLRVAGKPRLGWNGPSTGMTFFRGENVVRGTVCSEPVSTLISLLSGKSAGNLREMTGLHSPNCARTAAYSPQGAFPTREFACPLQGNSTACCRDLEACRKVILFPAGRSRSIKFTPIFVLATGARIRLIGGTAPHGQLFDDPVLKDLTVSPCPFRGNRLRSVSLEQTVRDPRNGSVSIRSCRDDLRDGRLQRYRLPD